MGKHWKYEICWEKVRLWHQLHVGFVDNGSTGNAQTISER